MRIKNVLLFSLILTRDFKYWPFKYVLYKNICMLHAARVCVKQVACKFEHCFWSSSAQTALRIILVLSSASIINQTNAAIKV